jgi:hypothetical protein
MGTQQDRTVKPGDALGYFILVRPTDDHPWESDWNGTLYFSRDAADAEAREAAKNGYEAQVVVMRAIGELMKP